LVITCGGSKDTLKNDTKTGLHHLTGFAKNTAGTNVLMMCVCLLVSTCVLSRVNTETEIFNRKLYKIMKTFQRVQICDMSLIRKHYTPWYTHEQIRQRWITKLWAKQIKELFFSCSMNHTD